MSKKLLVADDSLTIQKVIKLALSNDDYQIQTLSDGNEALEQISLFRPDVVLIDIALQGKSAFDIKKLVNAQDDLKNVPFVLMSSAFEKVDEAKVALLQFDGRLTKPFDPSHLRSVLTAAMNTRQGSQSGKLPPPAPTPAPSFERASEPKFNPGIFQTEEPATGEIVLSDPIWSDPMSVKSTPPLSPPPMLEDTDIKHLTESTVKMSGLDDLGNWDIAENKKLPQPSASDINFFSDPVGEATPTIPALSGGFTDAEIERTSSFQSPRSLPSESEMTAIPSTAEIEELVEKQVKAQLEEMLRRTIPDIAERVIKQEIKRLLDGLV
jgi:CheY-like chemotaxis protein